MGNKISVPKVQQGDLTSNKTDQKELLVIGIGASAGGLEALEQFFENIPNDIGFAFVVIQHLDPSHESLLPALLQRITKLDVFQATDRRRVEPNCIYIIPPNKSISILNGVLFLSKPVELHGLRLPVDIFFRSLAIDRKEKSIGVILSGMGTDGSIGVKAIKEQNGIVIVQDPKSAKFDAMPRNAIESIVADIVAPADELPNKLISFLKRNQAKELIPHIDASEKSYIDKIVIVIREHTGHDFSLYKKTTMFRRIDRRKVVHGIEKIQTYLHFLQENPHEIDILFNELLIGVTCFFRDAPVWEALKELVFPQMLAKMPEGYVFRVWVPGCSTGEEAYSLAIIFKEALESLKPFKNISLQIFATDIDVNAIDKARKGFFKQNITVDVSPERISRYFKHEADGYLISPSIRESVVFATQNVTKDPPFTKLDMISCRNMLIYMEPALQRKLIGLFNYCLNPQGLLILGSAETLNTSNDGFTEINGKNKIFKKTGNHGSYDIIDFPSSFRYSKTFIREKMEPSKVVENIQTIADQIIIQRFAPASVIVNSKGDIIYITGRTGKYLEPVAGKANWNIHAMAREGLGTELPGAFRSALQSFEPVVLRNLKVGTNGGTQVVDVIIQCLESPEPVKGMIIVVFSDVRTLQVNEPLTSKSRRSAVNKLNQELEIALRKSNEELQSIREEMQTSQEELKSTNEELQSTNEELQSTNEELTTSKEEMQSLNEELQTVNAELQSKVSEFIKANDDMKNLLNSTEVATLFLDKDLNIRRFTDPVTKIFKLRNSDIGRPFTDQVTNLKYADIEQNAIQVLKTLVYIEKAITTIDDRWFNIRIMPYRTIDDRIDGLVITFNDITAYKKMEIELRSRHEAGHEND